MALTSTARLSTFPRLLSGIALAILATTASTVHAETPPGDDAGASIKGWAFVFENDLLGIGGSAKDRWYTNGLQLMLAFDQGREPELLKPLVSWGRWLVPQGCQGAGCTPTMNVVLGQNIYTPQNLGTTAPQPQDRPWAGWLYAGVGLSTFDGHRQQLLNVKAGPTGPASLAEKTQKGAHCCLGSSTEPLGWDNQLRPMLGVEASYLSTHYFLQDSPVGLQSAWGGSVGNVRTYLRGSMALTWSPAGSTPPGSQSGSLDEGEFFTPDFGAKSVDGSLLDSLRHTVFYVHAQLSAVAYNVFLQGQTYSGRSQIDPERLVGTTTLGFTIPFGDNGRHKLGMAFKRRSPEFRIQGFDPRQDRYQSWGVITYSRDL